MFIMRFLGFPSSLRICLSLPIFSSSYGHSVFLLRGLQLFSFPNPGGDPRAQILKLAALSYMLREWLAVNDVWLSPNELASLLNVLQRGKGKSST